MARSACWPASIRSPARFRPSSGDRTAGGTESLNCPVSPCASSPLVAVQLPQFREGASNGFGSSVGLLCRHRCGGVDGLSASSMPRSSALKNRRTWLTDLKGFARSEGSERPHALNQASFAHRTRARSRSAWATAGHAQGWCILGVALSVAGNLTGTHVDLFCQCCARGDGHAQAMAVGVAASPLLAALALRLVVLTQAVF